MTIYNTNEISQEQINKLQDLEKITQIHASYFIEFEDEQELESFNRGFIKVLEDYILGLKK